jgi:hypothetical protein
MGKLVLKYGIWELYRDGANCYRIEAFDHRTGKEYNHPFLRVAVENSIFSDRRGQKIIYPLSRWALPSGAYNRFLQKMIKLEGL